MAKTYSISVRVALAFAVAFISDGLQLLIIPLTGTGIFAIPGEVADIVLDAITAVILSLLIGFHPILLPSFVIKAVPVIDIIPTWTACVTYLTWKRKREAANEPQTPSDLDKTQPAKQNPRPATLSVSTFPIQTKAGSSGLWSLVAAVALVAGLIWFTHRKHEAAEPPPFNPDPGSVTASPAPVPDPAPFQYSGTNPVVVVGNIENQSPANSQGRRGQPTGSPERIRSYIEELVRGIDGVQLLERQQAQVFLGQWKENPGGQTAEQNAAKQRMTASPVIVVLGAILDMHDDTANFKGYGITAKTQDTECSMRMQVMRAADGSITFSKILAGSKTQTQSDAAQTTSTDDRGFEAIKNALQKLENDADFKDAVRGIKHEQVEVEFAPKPDNCDIEIDGHYVGGSPVTQKLLSGHEIKVRISKAGFKDWQGRLLPQAGLRVTRELEPAETRTQTP